MLVEVCVCVVNGTEGRCDWRVDVHVHINEASTIHPLALQSAGPREPWRTHLPVVGSAPPASALKVLQLPGARKRCARHGRCCCQYAERVRVRVGQPCVFRERQEGKKTRQCQNWVGHISTGIICLRLKAVEVWLWLFTTYYHLTRLKILAKHFQYVGFTITPIIILAEFKAHNLYPCIWYLVAPLE